MKLSPVQIPERPRGLRFDIAAYAGTKFEVAADVAVIRIFDVIGLDVTPERIALALQAIGNQPVTVQINSPGGDPFDGLTIFNLLSAHPAPVTVQVLGIAASAASIIAMAGERIQISRSAQIMIHRAHGGALGTSNVMRMMADALERTDAAMAGLYVARSGQTLARVVAMMEAETFMSADEAIELGFADALLDRDALPRPQRVAASAPNTKPELEELLRRGGFSRSSAARMTAAAWAARTKTEDPGLDLELVTRTLGEQVARLKPFPA